MGQLLVGQIDLNDANMVSSLISVVRRLVGSPLSYHVLKFKPPHYFEVPDGTLSSGGGWYIILDSRTPIYVGQANDLNNRLNTNDGSRDNFGNPKRKSDDKRNVIKKLVELGAIDGLRVCVLDEKDVCSGLHLDSAGLTGTDRGSIEKLVDIYRCHLAYVR